MGWGTGIDYAHATFSPWIGCTKESPGCSHCYAEGYGARLGIGWGPYARRRFMPDQYWKQPLAWNRRAAKRGERYRVFASLCDPFELLPESHPDQERMENEIVRLCHMIEQTRALDWLLLTKRPANIPESVPVGWYRDGFPSNLWLGTTCEDQKRANERVPLLLEVPAVVRWVSYEPALGPLNLLNRQWVVNGAPVEGFWWLDDINWVVIGCESGPRARPMELEWAPAVVDQTRAAGVACFTKQLPYQAAPYARSTGGIVKSAELGLEGWPVEYPKVAA